MLGMLFSARHLPLTTLDLSQNCIGDGGATSIAVAISRGQLCSLRVLNLGWNEIADAGVGAIAAALVTRLRSPEDSSEDAVPAGVSLPGTRASMAEDQDAETVGLPELIELRLDRNQLGDAAAVALSQAAAAGGVPSLQVLSVFANPRIGDRGAQSLAPLLDGAAGALRGLELFEIDSCHVTIHGAMTLVQAATKSMRSKRVTLKLDGERLSQADRKICAEAATHLLEGAGMMEMVKIEV